MIHRRITKCGGLNIPKQVRTAMGIVPGSAVDMELDGDSIIIRAHMPRCSICGAPSDIEFKETKLCLTCCSGISKAAYKEVKTNDNERAD